MTSQAISCIFGLLIVTSFLCLAASYPHGYGTSVTDENINECNVTLHPEIVELCQQCAKQTKANTVYPMCCEDREEARAWCQKYLDFGQMQ